MFTTELANIYSKIPYLNEIIPFYELSPQIELFMNQEVRLGASNLNPYRFSYNFGHDPKNVINLFIAFSSSDGPLKRLYRVECSECEETSIITANELINFKCFNCGYTGDLENGQFLENAKVLFEIKEPYLTEVRTRLKDQASSEKKRYISEEALKKDVTLTDLFAANNMATETKDIELEQLENQILHRAQFGLNSL